MGNDKQQPIAIVKGQGCHVWDAAGRRYLDMIAGIATVGLGHCNPKVGAALEAQARKLWHASNVVYTEPQVELAERLCESSFAERVSGVEANEAALKLARRWQRDRGEDRFEIVAFENSFHGRIFAATATVPLQYWRRSDAIVRGASMPSRRTGSRGGIGRCSGDRVFVAGQAAARSAVALSPLPRAPTGFLGGRRELADDVAQSCMGPAGTQDP